MTPLRQFIYGDTMSLPGKSWKDFPKYNPQPVLCVTLDGHIKWSNQAAQQLFGWEENGPMDLPADFSDLLSRVIVNEPIQINWTNGTHHYFFNGNSIDSGACLLLYGQDITTIKHYEQQLKQYLEVLNDIACRSAHQTRQPIANMLGLLHLLEKSDDASPADLLLEKLTTEVKRLDNMVHEIVALIEQNMAAGAKLLGDGQVSKGPCQFTGNT